MLHSSAHALCRVHDVAMLDLDGVVYVGDDAVPGAAQALAAASESGLRCAFITNNASRPARVVADHLHALGVSATADDVVTSAQAAARMLRDRLGPQGRVAVLGAAGLAEAVSEAGLTAVGIDEEASAVVTGYGPDVPWRDLMQGAVRIRDGLWWVATNADLTIPTPYGVAPGHGVLVRMVRDFTAVEPAVAGKPEAPLLEETIRRMGCERPLMIGDRLDTDIEGARRLGIASLLVLTGVTGLEELVAAEPGQRPSYVGSDLSSLLVTHPRVEQASDAVTCGGWTVGLVADRLHVRGSGAVDDWWRAVSVAGWTQLDRTGRVADVTGLADQVPRADPQAR